MSRVRFAVACALLGAVLAPSAATAQSSPLACKPWGRKPPLGTLCTLAHDDTVKGRRLPAGTLLRYDSTGALIFFWLTKPAVIDGLALEGSSDGPHHTLFPDGAPRMWWLSRTQDVQSVPCRPIRFWTEVVGRSSAVYFHRNGTLAACRLGRAAVVRGRRFASGDRVAFDSTGALVP
ncbi:MAG: hypothetical protein P3B98_05870 [Gemmatimonadota bacterium]|nr:hypothetical protein [Gemmatimonadota bacterium]